MIVTILVALVALEHLYILYLEMFAWTSPRALKAFGLSKELAEETKAMAANQGLYNGFLAAALAWSLVHPNPQFALQLQTFFLVCIVIAAFYGSLTIKRSILIVQGIPALLALLAVVYATP
ncbi:hypothetical protein A374_17804 [Fictibacillus macauensis ZFHKF-1]|uniref:Integral membrane protein n=1 Tax=Fictibacillus macauensis ZFHKF-1 TaxID=1196324 RepID=I8AEY4_9BACL|nr:DUF1304 domain-containing protein [Fictibacillus macauensis]EIT83914.1 hypothetical protein A374_17804 [Fictibacillus macauensis ZFHKF-1]